MKFCADASIQMILQQKHADRRNDKKKRRNEKPNMYWRAPHRTSRGIADMPIDDPVMKSHGDEKDPHDGDCYVSWLHGGSMVMALLLSLGQKFFRKLITASETMTDLWELCDEIA